MVKNNKPKKWRHDELADDLAEHLGRNSDRIIWKDMQLGQSGSPRPDVFTVPKSYSRFTPISYEIKVSVSDFRSDITKGKWQSYLKFSSGVIFAVPKGLISKEDLPERCGLIERSESGWRMVKGPTLDYVADNLPKDFWIKLLIDGVDRAVQKQKHTIGFEYRAEKAITKRYGAELGEALSRRDRAISTLNYRTEEVKKSLGDIDLIRHAERQRELVEDDKQTLELIRNDLCEFLKLSTGASSYEIRSGLRLLKMILTEDGQIKQGQVMINKVENSIERTLRELKQFRTLIEPVEVEPMKELVLNEQSNS